MQRPALLSEAQFPVDASEWYIVRVSGTHLVKMGDRGRLVVPSALRERAGLAEGRQLVLVETDDGIVLLTQDQLKRRVRADLEGLRLVDELLAARRVESADDDAL